MARRASGETQFSASIAAVIINRLVAVQGRDTSFKHDLSYGPKIQGNDDPVRIFRETSFRDISSRRRLNLCVSTDGKERVGGMLKGGYVSM